MHLLTALIVTESMSSIAEGRSGLAMMLDTHLPASTSELNAATVIAENSLGPVVVEYPLGDGRVLVRALESPSASCDENFVRYVGSLAQ